MIKDAKQVPQVLTPWQWWWVPLKIYTRKNNIKSLWCMRVNFQYTGKISGRVKLNTLNGNSGKFRGRVKLEFG